MFINSAFTGSPAVVALVLGADDGSANMLGTGDGASLVAKAVGASLLVTLGASLDTKVGDCDGAVVFNTVGMSDTVGVAVGANVGARVCPGRSGTAIGTFRFSHPVKVRFNAAAYCALPSSVVRGYTA